MTDRAWELRPLAAEDCDELGRVHLAVWRDAYAGLMPAEYLAGLSEERCAARWREIVGRLVGAPQRTLVVIDPDGRLAGFGSAGPSRDDDAPTGWELYAVNLLAHARSTGVADRLVDDLLGERDATLWVLEGQRPGEGLLCAPRVRRRGWPRPAPGHRGT